MNARDLLAAATPRPWIQTGLAFRIRDGAVVRALGHVYHAGRQMEDATADVALIVAAVNEYEALLDCADLLRAAATAEGPASLGDALVDARAALVRLDAARSNT